MIRTAMSMKDSYLKLVVSSNRLNWNGLQPVIFFQNYVGAILREILYVLNLYLYSLQPSCAQFFVVVTCAQSD